MKDQEFLPEGVLQFRLIDIEVAKVGLEDPNEDPRQRAGSGRSCERESMPARTSRSWRRSTRTIRGARRAVCGRPGTPTPWPRRTMCWPGRRRTWNEGQVAGPIESSGHFFLMKVEEKQERSYRPLERGPGGGERRISRDRRWSEMLEELDAEIATAGGPGEYEQVRRILPGAALSAGAGKGGRIGDG